jgi:hypothetical protein
MLGPENDREREVLSKLDIEKILPRPLDIKRLEELEKPMNLEEDDIFEVARKRGQRLTDMDELKIGSASYRNG